MYSFDDKLAHIRPFRAGDFAEVESLFDAHGAQELIEPI